jgi:hypothetical protein
MLLSFLWIIFSTLIISTVANVSNAQRLSLEFGKYPVRNLPQTLLIPNLSPES